MLFAKVSHFKTKTPAAFTTKVRNTPRSGTDMPPGEHTLQKVSTVLMICNMTTDQEAALSADAVNPK